ncbi:MULTISPECIES: O-antigen ligase family protein [Halanaerobium]|jgi:O-antigen ligase|uniref:O-antigen ligase n=2 Tax=Halanaerobium congolense TaxID=54121 RepID=A0A1M7JUA3_9FIRM|nr:MULTISPECIES: O-antigen ligase family protein [Halanaerobium]PUU87352.1 MAG: Uncharacterized protein CI949_3606 [Halanaerobium sp.]TDS31540.1 O-antigen ligase [Halanaerobium congolense]SDI33126.1 O-antigen ligase [Halanaerobium congolense]SDK44857.1 O-antigen ligase [Halanaerobium congolense]SDM75925.1 O-antigen ligase [Halanaerobium congolense]
MNKDRMVVIISKAIIWSIYIFTLGIFTSKFLIYLGMGFSLIFWLVKIGILRKDYKFIKTEYLIPILLFSASIFISGIGNWNNEILQSKFFYSFIFFFIVVNEIKEKKIIINLFKLMLFSATIAALYGLYQKIFLGINRVTGFTSSLAFGNFMAVLVAFLSVYLIWGNLKKNQKLLFFVLDLLFLFNLIFTKTRGAWLGFLAAVFILGLLKGKKILLVSIIILLIIFISLPNVYTERFISSFNIEYDLKTNRSNTTRIGLWTSAVKMFMNNPINGVGYDQFKQAYINNYKIKGISPFSHSHNNLLNFAAELGIIGLLSFLYLMFIVLKRLIIDYKYAININYKLFYLSSILVFVIYNVQGLTQYNFGDTEPLHLFWFFIAITFIISNLNFNTNSVIKDK